MAKKIFIIAGEASGDFLGAKLIEELKNIYGPDIQFKGVAGELMEAQGIKTLFPLSDLSLFGFFELIPHLRKIRRRILETVQAIEEFEPDMVITIDAQGFAKQIAKRIKHVKTFKLHYVAPTVWAWRHKRVWKYAKYFDHILCLYPFEKPFFRPTKLPLSFVGHPLVEQQGMLDDLQSKKQELKEAFGLDKKDILLCLLPGSRKSEIKNLLPIFCETASNLYKKNNQLKFILPVVPHVSQEVEDEVKKWNLPLTLVSKQEKEKAFIASDAAIAASGSVALELALAKTPFLIAYKINPLTIFLLKKLFYIGHVNMINIILDFMGKIEDEVPVPEYLQDSCTVELIEKKIEELLNPDNSFRSYQIKASQEALSLLKPKQGTPSQAAALKVKELLGE